MENGPEVRGELWLLLECLGNRDIDDRGGVIKGRCLGRLAFFAPMSNFADFGIDGDLGFGGVVG